MLGGASEHFSPFKYFYQFLPPTDDKALRQAFYNTITLAFLFIFSLTCVAVYFILEAFIRPLIWALLIGSCLHPLKRRLSSTLKQWVHQVQDSNRPLFAEAAFFPFLALNTFLDFIGIKIYHYLKYIILAVVLFPCVYFLPHFQLSHLHLDIVVSIWNGLSNFLSYFSTAWILLAVILYLTLVAFYWTPESHTLLKVLSLPVWIGVVFHVSSLTGVLGVPLFIFFTFLVCLGCAVEIRDSFSSGVFHPGRLWRRITQRAVVASPEEAAVVDAEEESPERRSPLSEESPASDAGEQAPPPAAAHAAAAALDDDDDDVNDDEAASAAPPPAAPAGAARPTVSRRRRRRQRSRSFFVWLLCGHALAYACSQPWVLSLVPIAAVLLAARRLATSICSSEPVHSLTTRFREKLVQLAAERQDALLPLPVRGVCKLLLRGDHKLADILANSIDTIVSIFVICLVLTASVFLTIFLVLQVQRESIELITMTSSVLNSTVVSASSSLLPEKDNLQKILDSMLGNAYVFGRQWISSKIKTIFDTSDYNKAKIEEQVLQLWDRLYEKLAAKNVTWTPLWSQQAPAVANESEKQQQRLQRQASALLPNSAWELLTNLLDASKILQFVKENLGVLTSVLESVWVVVKGNLSLLSTVLTTVLSVLLGGGTAVLNFLLQSLVFLTSLYLLLRFSGELYLPVQFVSSLSSGKQQHPVVNALYGAVNDATSGVFLASLKIACFYGLYTNLVHSVFSVNLVFVPSVLAAVFGAVPFLGTYWACVPGLLELLLLQEQPALAIAFAVLHVLPTYAVDTIIYGEIKGAGHPYLTGLSVAGGLYWYGLEGAIFGPMLLACLLVAVNVYSLILSQPAGVAGRQRMGAGAPTDRLLRRTVSMRLQQQTND